MAEQPIPKRPYPRSAEMNIVNNLRAGHPELANYQDWQLALGYRHFSVSEDYPDESKLTDWIPNVEIDSIVEYMSLQMGDLARALNEVEKYNTTLLKENRELKRQLKEANDAAMYTPTAKK